MVFAVFGDKNNMIFLYLHTVMLNYAPGCAVFCWVGALFSDKGLGGICTRYEKDFQMEKKAFIDAFNSLIENKEEIITGYEVILEELLDTTKLEKKVATIQNEMEIIEELFKKMVNENSRKAMDQKEYSKKYNELVERYKKAQDELNEIGKKQQENKVRKDSIDTFIDRLKSQDTILTDFDETLWTSTIDRVVIEKDITFYFKDGTKIKQKLL